MYIHDLSGRARAAELIKDLHKAGAVSLDKVDDRGGELRKGVGRQVLRKSLESRLAKVGMRVRDSTDLERVDDTFNAAGVRGDGIAAIRKIHAAGPHKAAVALPPENFGISGSPARPQDHGAVDPHDDPSAGFNGMPPNPTLASPPHASAFTNPSRVALNAPSASEPTEDRSLEAIKKALAGPRRQWFPR